jgi:hypothetical protein
MDGISRWQMGSYRQRQRLDLEVQLVNHIAEICAELAPYRILIAIDEILEHYTTEVSLREMEAVLSKLLQSVQASEILTQEASRDRRIR